MSGQSLLATIPIGIPTEKRLNDTLSVLWKQALPKAIFSGITEASLGRDVVNCKPRDLAPLEHIIWYSGTQYENIPLDPIPQLHFPIFLFVALVNGES